MSQCAWLPRILALFAVFGLFPACNNEGFVLIEGEESGHQDGGHFDGSEASESVIVFDESLLDTGLLADDAASLPDLKDDSTDCGRGNIRGRICAPDFQTWMSGAEITVEAIDCYQQPVQVSAISDANGYFLLSDVPVGEWTVTAVLGQFNQEVLVKVTADKTTQIQDNELCVAQKNIKIAVITGNGDDLELMLNDLNLEYTTYRGSNSYYAQEAEPFLSDLEQLKQYNLIFFNCAVAQFVTHIDLGENAIQIGQNLHDFVAQGGSLYASDWALIFAYYVDPTMLHFMLQNNQTVSSPLDTNLLMGYAPQTVSANVDNPGLKTFLGKEAITVIFPTDPGMVCRHWGLIDQVNFQVNVLVSAPSLLACSAVDTTCKTSGATVENVPLVVDFKLTPANQKGGHVFYTAFHNSSQNGEDIQKILKYVVFQL